MLVWFNLVVRPHRFTPCAFKDHWGHWSAGFGARDADSRRHLLSASTNSCGSFESLNHWRQLVQVVHQDQQSANTYWWNSVISYKYVYLVVCVRNGIFMWNFGNEIVFDVVVLASSNYHDISIYQSSWVFRVLQKAVWVFPEIASRQFFLLVY